MNDDERSEREQAAALRDEVLREPTPPWTHERSQRVRRGLLERLDAAPAPRRTRRPRAWVAALAIGAAASVAYGAVRIIAPSPHDQPSSNPTNSLVVEDRRAQVHARAGADYALLGAQPDEVVRVFDGTVTVSVGALGDAERVRVLTRDAEMETREGTFDLEVEGDTLTSVRAISGEVELRLGSGVKQRLTAGERWTADAATATPLPSPSTPASSSAALAPSAASETTAKAARSATPSASVTRGPSADELAFKEAWQSIEKGDFASAAKRLEGVEGGSALAEDAEYWRAIALIKSGQAQAGEQQLEAFLKKHPTSRRRDEVLAALARLRAKAPPTP